MSNPPDLKFPRPSSPPPSSQARPGDDVVSSSEPATPKHLDAALSAAEAIDAGAPGAAAAPGAMPEASAPVLSRKDGSTFSPIPRDEWCKFFLAAHGMAGALPMIDSAAL